MPLLFDEIKSFGNVTTYAIYVADSQSKCLYSFNTAYLYELFYLINALGLISCSYKIYLSCNSILCIDFILEAVECYYE